MGWVSPDSTNDPDSVWANDTNVYDENTATYATVPHQGVGCYLELILSSAINCDKVQIFAHDEYFMGDTDPDVSIDVWYSNAWHTIFTGTITHDTWVEKPIGSTVSTTKARVKANSLGTGHSLKFYEFDFNEVEAPPPTRRIFITHQYSRLKGLWLPKKRLWYPQLRKLWLPTPAMVT